ncbi:surface antigen [Plasmodium falciparum UGT5.1]|uniref:Surface antigen n=1 Tax=Plasmodium falciparum UGT5.1 TaxID=1237627 RepID=W7JBA1_PLAFA|nr:surface antigen [Plasmodium falciparum UGT5.1]
MKRVMENFSKQTQQRFHEYDERMKTTRQKCREQCDKEIQKIILKDKLEKQMEQQFSTLHTDIQNDAIPTCVCEKSLADKTEKVCLKCGYGLGSVAPTVGLIGAVAVNAWKNTALKAAIVAAQKAGAAAGKAAGDIAGAAKVIDLIESTFYINELGGNALQSLFNAENYMNAKLISGFIQAEYSKLGCGKIFFSFGTNKRICTFVNGGIVTTRGVGTGGSANDFIKTTAQNMVSKAESVAAARAAKVTSETTATLTAKNTGEVNATYMGYQTPIIASVVAILIIVLVMVIIYLILRYRRKKKMKKKLQYIKLLEE